MSQQLKLIGICGKKFSGKDTMADHLVKKYGYHKLSLGDPLKQALQVIFGFSDTQLWGSEKEQFDFFWQITPREIMQSVGTELFRVHFGQLYPHIGGEIWVMSLQHHMEQLIQQGISTFVVPDIRFPNEVQWLRRHGGTLVQVTRITTEETTKVGVDHISEHALDQKEDRPDYIIENNGTYEELYQKVDHLMMM